MKQKIAFDLDDVVADATEFWRVEINNRTGAKLEKHHYKVPNDYWGYYEAVWQSHGINELFSVADIDAHMVQDQSGIKAYAQSIEALTKLAQTYDLAIVTARNSKQKDETLRWLQTHFPDLFKEVHFANGSEGIKVKNKGDICKEINAQWLVDDNPSHCQDALDAGIEVVLFGEYGWHHTAPQHLHRCKDWPAVMEYFNAQHAKYR